MQSVSADEEDYSWMLKHFEAIDQIIVANNEQNEEIKNSSTEQQTSDRDTCSDKLEEISHNALPESGNKVKQNTFASLKLLRDRNEETLRKLKLVKIHRKKNDLRSLEKLITKWRTTCQSALNELIQYSSKEENSMFLLIKHLNIDPSLVKFDVKKNCFSDF